ncbi:hematopoietic progenitor cell antigen CD34 [Rhinophrynus dorsalis]
MMLLLLCRLRAQNRLKFLCVLISILAVTESTTTQTNHITSTVGPVIVTSTQTAGTHAVVSSPPINETSTSQVSVTKNTSEPTTNLTSSTEGHNQSITVPITTIQPTSPFINTSSFIESNTVPNVTTNIENNSTNATSLMHTNYSEMVSTSTIMMTSMMTSNSPEESITKRGIVSLRVVCQNLRNRTSNSEVACFEYKEKVNCEQLTEKEESRLKSILCNMTGTHESPCHLTLHSSEVNPKCILWIPTIVSKDAKQQLESHHSALRESGIEVKWGQISDHQTRTQKTMIALVTCGVLMAFLIITGYVMSNRESWSPGRQRLGEDPFYTETDTQGNTLVSVSANVQEKGNSETRENGTGQAVTPTATNGHSNKKQAVSDTKV